MAAPAGHLGHHVVCLAGTEKIKEAVLAQTSIREACDQHRLLVWMGEANLLVACLVHGQCRQPWCGGGIAEERGEPPRRGRGSGKGRRGRGRGCRQQHTTTRTTLEEVRRRWRIELHKGRLVGPPEGVVEQVDLGVGGADKPVDLMAGLWAMGRGEL